MKEETSIEWSLRELAESNFFPFNSVVTIRRLIENGKIKAIKYGPKKIRIPQIEIDRFLKEAKKNM